MAKKAEKDAAKEAAKVVKEAAKAEKDAAKEAAKVVKEAAKAEKEAAKAEKDAAKEAAKAEKEAAKAEKEAAKAEKEAAKADKDAAKAEKDAAKHAKEAAKQATSTDHKKCEYAKLHNYYKDGKLNFDVKSEPTVAEFTEVIGEPMHLVARCVLNTPENFPYKTKKDGTPTKKQREYFEDIPTYTGKKVDYLSVDEAKWINSNNEWLYCLVYNKHIVKIGMTITSLKERWCGSYSCGTSRAMTKGSCSTTNFIITECNFGAVHCGMDVEIYAISCHKEAVSVSRFGQTKIIYTSRVRGYETMLSQCFHTTYKHKPVLCVQEGN
jgi:hypothetical protein